MQTKAGKIGVGLIILAILLGGGAYFLGVFESPDTAARTQLKTVFESWLAQKPKAAFQAAHPDIHFQDIDYFDRKLVRYEIAAPTDREGAYVVLSAKLVVDKDGKELDIPRTYKVGRVKVKDQEAWVILGHTK
jgi:hypothetical protein